MLYFAVMRFSVYMTRLANAWMKYIGEICLAVVCSKYLRNTIVPTSKSTSQPDLALPHDNNINTYAVWHGISIKYNRKCNCKLAKNVIFLKTGIFIMF